MTQLRREVLVAVVLVLLLCAGVLAACCTNNTADTNVTSDPKLQAATHSSSVVQNSHTQYSGSTLINQSQNLSSSTPTSNHVVTTSGTSVTVTTRPSISKPTAPTVPTVMPSTSIITTVTTVRPNTSNTTSVITTTVPPTTLQPIPSQQPVSFDVGTPGIVFTSNGDGTCWVDSLLNCTDPFVCIPYRSPEGDLATGLDSALGNNSFIRAVWVPDSVQVMKVSFTNFKALEKIVLSPNITKIDDRAFQGCVSLKTVECSCR